MGEVNSAKGHRDGWDLKQLPSEESLNNHGWLEKMWLWVLKLKEGLWTPRGTFSPYGQESRGTGCSQSVLEVFKT